MQKFDFKLSITTDANVTSERIAALLTKLLDIGLAYASLTLDKGEGDIEMAALASSVDVSSPEPLVIESSVKVMHWSAYGLEGVVDTHQIDIEDYREANGQLAITAGPLDGNVDEMLGVMLEIGTNPLNGVDQVPVAHIQMNGGDDNLLSVYHLGNKLLLLPELNAELNGPEVLLGKAMAYTVTPSQGD